MYIIYSRWPGPKSPKLKGDYVFKCWLLICPNGIVLNILKLLFLHAHTKLDEILTSLASFPIGVLKKISLQLKEKGSFSLNPRSVNSTKAKHTFKVISTHYTGITLGITHWEKCHPVQVGVC